MVCGIKWKARICELTADIISKKLNITVHRGYRSKKENEIAGKENSYKRSGKYKCFIVEVERNGSDYFLTVRGSLHKYFHGKNCGSFYGFEILEAIKRMCDYFGLKQNECEVYNIEIGINILVWFDVYDYLKNNLIQHKKERFQNMPDSKKVGFLAIHEDYLIKLYQKLNDLLRYEIKLKSKKMINKAGIYTLADINELHINKLAGDLVKEWEEIITRDGLNLYDRRNRFDLLSEKEREKILEFTSQVFIQSYHDKLRTASSLAAKDQLRQEAYRLKKCCRDIIKKHGNGDHNKLYKLIYDLVESFKSSWGEAKGEMSRFPPLMKRGNRDKRNNEESNNSDIQIASKIKINMSNTGSEKKSNKQLAVEKREQKKLIYNSFMSKLKVTLEVVDQKGKQEKRNKDYKIAA